MTETLPSVVAIDIGTHKISVLVGRVHAPDRIEVLGMAHAPNRIRNDWLNATGSITLADTQILAAPDATLNHLRGKPVMVSKTSNERKAEVSTKP